ncbi:hypothetical protein M9194_04230 [Vibrio sp. S4M6]|uniref:hypothetical protein n=1 Tax=Vibrio sinus TaxID=2946865 RepID=UPI00202AB85E|nr:hypothetical protein [Vibrio sinus]MCL9780643.1 hypothetical protein [Vibrio sinus]
MFRVLKKWLTDTKKEAGVDAELYGDPLLQDGELYFEVKLAGLTQLQRYSAKEILTSRARHFSRNDIRHAATIWANKNKRCTIRGTSSVGAIKCFNILDNLTDEVHVIPEFDREAIDDLGGINNFSSEDAYAIGMAQAKFEFEQTSAQLDEIIANMTRSKTTLRIIK